MSTFLMVLHVFTCLILVLVVLVQSGKEGGLGMMGGGTGSSQSVFGSSGGADFFTKFTSGAAAIFMITSVFLSVVKGGHHGSVFAATPATATLPSGTSAAPSTTTAAPAATAPSTPATAPSTPQTPNAKK